MESVESSDVDSETSETSSDVLGELYREFPDIKAEIDAEIREEKRERKREEDGTLRPKKLPKPIVYKMIRKRSVVKDPEHSER